MKFLRKIQLLQLLSTLFFINQAQIAWSLSAKHQPVLAKPSKKITYFEYNFPGTGITIQTTKNVITFYGATKNEIDQIVACLRFNYSCLCCYGFITREQDAHKGLHPDSEQMEIDHCHVMHRRTIFIAHDEVKRALQYLEDFEIIEKSDVSKCLKNFDSYYIKKRKRKLRVV